ncbi:sensor histidine kinase [Leifsonia poae]|uniref:sensor histidine kinase n=1 Tax=Leifsonia poae TaxID=110933 RepID=UPI001CBEECD9|nr:ATP-binding protein [Leifsonia poae]
MSLGLPSHLSRAANSRALATAARWAALVCLASALLNVAISSVGSTETFTWVTLIALVPMIGLLLLLSRRRTALLTVAYLVIGTVSTYCYVVTLLTENASYHDTNLFVIALPIVAMTLVGGTGTGALAGVLWATLGFALAEAAVVLASVTAGREFRTDAISLGAYLLLVGVLSFDGLTRGSRSRSQSAIHRSIRDARLNDLRRDLSAESAAELHDTVLSELIAIAAAGPGPLAPRLRDRVEADLRRLGKDPSAGDEPAPDRSRHGHPPESQPGEIWFGSELHHAIELARDEGLSVDLSGDRDALALLGAERRRAVGLAARQCLVNVLRHSGSATAEVAISASSESVSVMVVDGGRGFAPASTASDRLGLRQSVHDRIERVGGAVTIYSSPDVGTTVMIVVPIGEPEEAIAS